MRKNDFLSETVGALYRLGFSCFTPFFANTYPLGFHFASQCRGASDIRSRFALTGWEDDCFTSESRWSRPFVFYCSPKQFRGLQQSTIRDFGNVYRERVSRFKIGSVFLRGWEVNDSEEIDLKGLVARLSSASGINVYSDIPTQARLFVEDLTREFPTGAVPEFHHRFLRSEFAGMPLIERASEDLFVTGAPLTWAMRNRLAGFVRIDIGNEWLSSLEEWDLLCGFYVPERHAGSVPIAETRALLIEYHRNLFARAREPRQMEFADVFLSYSYIARNSMPLDAFRDHQDFAACLAEHHSFEVVP